MTECVVVAKSLVMTEDLSIRLILCVGYCLVFLGWCDFAVTLCGWRVAHGWFRHEPDADAFRTRSSPADSGVYTLCPLLRNTKSSIESV